MGLSGAGGCVRLRAAEPRWRNSREFERRLIESPDAEFPLSGGIACGGLISRHCWHSMILRQTSAILLYSSALIAPASGHGARKSGGLPASFRSVWRQFASSALRTVRAVMVFSFVFSLLRQRLGNNQRVWNLSEVLFSFCRFNADKSR